ncbi:glycosylhydrolase-like jelly roll fold domain-containing protein [Paenibacillus sp. XY044]|uniref:glycosylhydrolase-like jelly roll fold domain-containing protein n=1 Tax=Paenibacillus sp. XY044 TaxID=2026089 RepID=UPI000B99BB55|nr:glycosylhydrolase-like jelly roll fold domain-containing protein [Paenibacillus sp. XY044]OZB91282.1 hypothetical protein CJP46_28740 [Paenibacillus sp. XY044]
MTEIENLKQQFADPPAEFSPIPFWFWNDALSEEEIIRQIRDFHAKEVAGFVIHPRMGMPREIPYLSEKYMDLVETAVSEAADLGMRVILYDEGMYPSGSACGLVVQQNPGFASLGLRLQEIPCDKGSSPVRVPFALSPGETLVSVQAVAKQPTGEVRGGTTLVLEYVNDGVSFTPPDEGNWSLLCFVETPSQGTIRGVHPGQDDGEPDAPLAADLLNPDAVKSFITITHERYYQRLHRYFGTTVFAFFTDEPDLLGRGHTRGLKPWTNGFLNELIAGGFREQDLPALWLEMGDSTVSVREAYETAVRNRLARTYYKQIADWCEAHGISLTGHPAGSDDIGLLEHFHIPGQDVVWRYIAPEDGKSLIGVHSTMGKCSSDAARHRGRRRNLNECFGVCGIEGGWSLSADNMKWYLDWLFVRGVNLISPHAFYYSIRGERRDERPPDVGPHNIWWPEYGRFARYIKRMSWMMTGGVNGAEIAVLAGPKYLPWQIVKPLYEQQIEFNYLEESLLNTSCQIEDGTIAIAGYRYKAILIEDSLRMTPASRQNLRTFANQGGVILEWDPVGEQSANIGQVAVSRVEEIPEELGRRLGGTHRLEPAAEAIRISRVTKNGICFSVIVNEGEEGYEGALWMNHAGTTEYWRPWTGECEAAGTVRTKDGQIVDIRLERRECIIIAVNPSLDDQGSSVTAQPVQSIRAGNVSVEDLSEGWQVVVGPWTGELPSLSSWTCWEGMNHFSGTVIYERSLEVADPSEWAELMLDLGDAHEFVRLHVNGREAGVRMWKPYVFDIAEAGLLPGTNCLRVSVTNSLANRFDGKSFPSGLLGPVQLIKVSTN